MRLMTNSNLQAVIMELVRELGVDKTICPSEAARAYAEDDNWRQWMEPVRKAARALHQENKIQIEQQGQPVDLDDITGPIRLRLKEA